MGIKRTANTYLVLALLLGAMLPVATDIAVNKVNIYEFLFVTYLISVPASLLFVFASKKQRKLFGYLRNMKDLSLIAFIGLLNYAFLEFGLLYAERFVTASLATVVYRSFPLLMLIFIPLVLRERVTKYQLVALLLAFAGLSIAVTGGSAAALGSANTGIVLFLIVVALASGLATVMVKRYVFDMVSSMFIFNIANLAFFSLLFALNGFPVGGISTSTWLAVLYTGVVYNVFVGFMYYGALRVLKTTFVTNIYFLSPFITFMYAALVLGEPIQLYYLVIAVLVSAGILVQRLDKKGGSYMAKAKTSRATLYDVSAAFVNTESAIIHDFVKGGGRVLAIKLKKSRAPSIRNLRPRETGVAYTDTDEKFVSRAEASFISEILGKTEDESVLMFAGDPNAGENYLTEAGQELSRESEGEGEALKG
jgi:drug/metabolite transporter (DMT)-like permease